MIRRPQAIAAIVALIAGGGFFATRGGGSDTAAPTPTVVVKGEVLREPISVPGPDPFTQPVSFVTSTTSATPTSISTTTIGGGTSAPPTTGATVALAATSGSTPGLYGGSLNNAECNKDQLIGFLEQNPDKGRAWAQVQQIQPAQIREYVGQLTPALLGADTRVTNNGFANGQPTPRQAVLQKGTAVLVDKFGAPRVRCYCGNPLAPPVAQADSASFTGPTWAAFDPTNLQAITPAAAPLATLQLKDANSDAGIARPVGTSGAQDVKTPAPPPLPEPRSRPITTITVPRTSAPTTTITTPSTPGPTGTTRPASIPAPNAFIQKEGAVSATSVFSPAFGTALAVDGKPETSWFSRGSQVDGPSTTFTWTYPKDELITLVRIVGNGAQSEPSFRKNYGFGSVIIRVLDANGRADFEQTVALPGTPDPDAVVQPGVRGRIIQLVFSGGEAPDCGGFSELEVGVTR